jgi:hypothetical protein
MGLKFPSSTYKQSFLERKDNTYLKGFNCEEWKYKSDMPIP